VQYGVRNYKTHCVGMRLVPTVKETSTDLTGQGDFSPRSCSYSAVSFMILPVNLKS
jgi:hypothetical protein